MKPNDKRLKNLITPQELNARHTPEERKAIASKAGKASGQRKRDNRTFKEIALMLMAEEASPEDIKRYNLPEGSSNSLVMLAAAAKKAKEGDMKALEVFRDTAGQMPTKDIQVTAEVFTEANKALLDKVAERIKETE
jgi:hypothetical protein